MGLLNSFLGSDDSNRKPDLIGTSGCQLGKKDERLSFYTQRCDWTCPLWRECARGRG